jgi:BolA family transcriptional regulator, general stress-responsive regulator
MITIKNIEDTLNTNLAIQSLVVKDNSFQHAGHNEKAKAGGTHFEIRCSAEEFNGLSPVAKQRLVNKILKPFFDQGMHALSLNLSSTS